MVVARDGEPQVAEPTVVAIGVSTRRRAPGWADAAAEAEVEEEDGGWACAEETDLRPEEGSLEGAVEVSC